MQVILNQAWCVGIRMATVVDMTIPTDQFALSETFDVVPDVTFETVRVAAHSPQSVMPFIRASSSEINELNGPLNHDTTTRRVVRLSRDDECMLYRITWGSKVRTAIEKFVQADGSLLGAYGGADRWKLRLLFPDQASVSETYNNWRDHSIDPSIQRVSGVSDVADSNGINLSSCQHETLIEAFETDYYDIPRGITLDGLADKLDVSHQALSERLRRGHRNLIATTLCDTPAVTKHPL
jgi:predicted DNA binding protein